MRDLDQIQERDADDRGRKLGTVLLATASVVGLTFAMGVVVGRAAEPTQPAAKDPLEQLLPGGAGTGLDANGAAAPADKPVARAQVEAADLSFPNTLSEEEDRPEVLAALRAAALEEAALAQPTAPQAGDDDEGLPTVAAAIAAAPTGIRFSEEAEPAPDTQDMLAAVPAAVAAGSGDALQQSAQHDPMVADALRAEQPAAPPAARGYDGEYTLQVISYDSAEPAKAFADGLRAKGHEAFVVRADVPDRGRFYRVRVGPFKNRQKADVYRRKFEQEERMNTFVVRKKPDE